MRCMPGGKCVQGDLLGAQNFEVCCNGDRSSAWLWSRDPEIAGTGCSSTLTSVFATHGVRVEDLPCPLTLPINLGLFFWPPHFHNGGHCHLHCGSLFRQLPVLQSPTIGESWCLWYNTDLLLIQVTKPKWACQLTGLHVSPGTRVTSLAKCPFPKTHPSDVSVGFWGVFEHASWLDSVSCLGWGATSLTRCTSS